MIKEHEFNTAWWGAPTGIVTDDAFFDLPADEQKEALAPFEWVEYKTGFLPDAPFKKIADAGFFNVDAQIPFRLDLETVTPVVGVEGISVVFGDEKPVRPTAEIMRTFAKERFNILPGCDAAKINARYERWGRRLACNQPGSALTVRIRGKDQGWFMSTAKGEEIEFTLGMLHKDAVLRGRNFYRAAFYAYAQRGYKLGTAAFSVMNPAVLNIFTDLGAKFLAAKACFFWINEKAS